jgi:hypothetical protein
MQNTGDVQSLAISGAIVYSLCSDQGDDGIDRSNVGAATQLLFLFVPISYVGFGFKRCYKSLK